MVRDIQLVVARTTMVLEIIYLGTVSIQQRVSRNAWRSVTALLVVSPWRLWVEMALVPAMPSHLRVLSSSTEP